MARHARRPRIKASIPARVPPNAVTVRKGTSGTVVLSLRLAPGKLQVSYRRKGGKARGERENFRSAPNFGGNAICAYTTLTCLVRDPRERRLEITFNVLKELHLIASYRLESAR